MASRLHPTNVIPTTTTTTSTTATATSVVTSVKRHADEIKEGSSSTLPTPCEVRDAHSGLLHMSSSIGGRVPKWLDTRWKLAGDIVARLHPYHSTKVDGDDDDDHANNTDLVFLPAEFYLRLWLLYTGFDEFLTSTSSTPVRGTTTTVPTLVVHEKSVYYGQRAIVALQQKATRLRELSSSAEEALRRWRQPVYREVAHYRASNVYRQATIDEGDPSLLTPPPPPRVDDTLSVELLISLLRREVISQTQSILDRVRNRYREDMLEVSVAIQNTVETPATRDGGAYHRQQEVTRWWRRSSEVQAQSRLLEASLSILRDIMNHQTSQHTVTIEGRRYLDHTLLPLWAILTRKYDYTLSELEDRETSLCRGLHLLYPKVSVKEEEKKEEEEDKKKVEEKKEEEKKEEVRASHVVEEVLNWGVEIENARRLFRLAHAADELHAAVDLQKLAHYTDTSLCYLEERLVCYSRQEMSKQYMHALLPLYMALWLYIAAVEQRIWNGLRSADDPGPTYVLEDGVVESIELPLLPELTAAASRYARSAHRLLIVEAEKMKQSVMELKDVVLQFTGRSIPSWPAYEDIHTTGTTPKDEDRWRQIQELTSSVCILFRGAPVGSAYKYNTPIEEKVHEYQREQSIPREVSFGLLSESKCRMSHHPEKVTALVLEAWSPSKKEAYLNTLSLWDRVLCIGHQKDMLRVLVLTVWRGVNYVLGHTGNVQGYLTDVGGEIARKYRLKEKQRIPRWIDTLVKPIWWHIANSFGSTLTQYQTLLRQVASQAETFRKSDT